MGLDLRFTYQVCACTYRVGCSPPSEPVGLPRALAHGPAQTFGPKTQTRGRKRENGGGWRGSNGSSIVLGSSSFPDPDWADLSNEISPRTVQHPPCRWCGVGPASAVVSTGNDTRQHIKMGHTLSRISHWTLDIGHASDVPLPSPPLRPSFPSFSLLHLLCSGRFCHPCPASCSPSPQ